MRIATFLHGQLKLVIMKGFCHALVMLKLMMLNCNLSFVNLQYMHSAENISDRG